MNFAEQIAKKEIFLSIVGCLRKIFVDSPHLWIPHLLQMRHALGYLVVYCGTVYQSLHKTVPIFMEGLKIGYGDDRILTGQIQPQELIPSPTLHFSPKQ